MKLIEPSVEILEQSSGLNGIYEQIEIAGRTCYKSEPTYSYFYTGKNPHDGGDITVQVSKEFDGEKAIEYAEKEYLNGNPSYSRKSISAKTFVDRMVASKHYAMLEHGTIYLHLNGTSRKCFEADIVKRYEENKYSKVQSKFENGETDYRDWYITTNYRVLIENNWLDDLQYICEPTDYHEKRITSKFICDRGVSHEFVRHRVFSFAQESTRFCNYSKDKFGNELTFIIPSWYNFEEGKYVIAENIGWVNAKYTFNKDESTGGPGTLVDFEYTKYPECPTILKDEYSFINVCGEEVEEYDAVLKYYGRTPLSIYLQSLKDCERNYFGLLDYGWKPQQARAVLPNSLKTELIMTGFTSDWEHFFELRCDKAAHPDARALAIPLQDKFKELELI